MFFFFTPLISKKISSNTQKDSPTKKTVNVMFLLHPLHSGVGILTPQNEQKLPGLYTVGGIFLPCFPRD